MTETKKRRKSDHEELEMYDRVCRPQLDALIKDVGIIKTKIFNGHSTSIERIESEVGEIRKMLRWLLTGIITILVGIVVSLVFGVTL